MLLKGKVDEAPDSQSVLCSYLLTQALICCCEDGISMFFGGPGSCECGGDVICLSVIHPVMAMIFIELQKLWEQRGAWREGCKLWADTIAKARVFDTRGRAKMGARIILQGL
jgi:hypothetical protein